MKNKKKKMIDNNSNNKKGVVYTPSNIVNFIISKLNITNKEYILEPAVGDGNFIIGLIEYIKLKYNLNKKELLEWFLKYVECFDIEGYALTVLKRRLCNYFFEDDQYNYHFSNIFNEDALLFDFNKHYDIVIGNPPYIRTKYLDADYLFLLRQKFKSCEKGNIDIYYAFVEKFARLSTKLGFIIPNSWLKNKSALYLKNNIIYPKLDLLIDFKEQKIFQSAQTYTSIIVLNGFLTNKDKYSYSNNLNNIYEIKNKLLDNVSNRKIPKYFYSGIATLADKLFIAEKINNKYYCTYKKNKYEVENDMISYYFKLTKLKEQFILFPYNKDNIIISEKILQDKFPLTYNYLLVIKSELSKRDKGKVDKYDAWYAYGRKQGLNKINGNNILIIPSIIGNNCKPQIINIEKYKDKRILFTSGFVLDYESINQKFNLEYFFSNDFFKYVEENGRIYPSAKNNYYSISANELNNLIIV